MIKKQKRQGVIKDDLSRENNSHHTVSAKLRRSARTPIHTVDRITLRHRN